MQTERTDTLTVFQGNVSGNIQAEDGGTVSLRRVTVGGDIQVFDNSGAILIESNTVDGNLQCKGNTSTPGGSNNVVDGNAEEQCAGLAG